MLTSLDRLGIGIGTSKLDIHKIDLEFLVGLDTNEQRRTTASGDDFIGEVDGLEDEGE